VQHLEATGEALAESLLHQERRRTQEHYFQPSSGTRVLVPEPLDRLGPADGLLHFVHDQHCLAAGVEPGGLPLLGDPVRSAKRGFVGADESHRRLQGLADLLDQRRLAYLSGTGDDLDEPSGLGEAAGELGGGRAPEAFVLFTHFDE
jgi:hypothetical protein